MAVIRRMELVIRGTVFCIRGVRTMNWGLVSKIRRGEVEVRREEAIVWRIIYVIRTVLTVIR